MLPSLEIWTNLIVYNFRPPVGVYCASLCTHSTSSVIRCPICLLCLRWVIIGQIGCGLPHLKYEMWDRVYSCMISIITPSLKRTISAPIDIRKRLEAGRICWHGTQWFEMSLNMVRVCSMVWLYFGYKSEELICRRMKELPMKLMEMNAREICPCWTMKV